MSSAFRAFLIVWLSACAACAQSNGSAVPPLSGEKAMEHVRAQVAFGPRPPGSDALVKCRDYILQQLKGYGYQVEEDAFEAATPYGPKSMVNLIARMKPEGGKVVALASHYDTKYYEKMHFVGANDAGSSTGLLLELARVMASKKHSLEYWFVFLDGEEAFVEWSSFDSTYGSRHLSQRWKKDGTAGKLGAFILLDMIGDKDLDLTRDENSTPWLMDLVWNTAREGGLGEILSRIPSRIEDDHIPFLDQNIPCVDVIDMNYAYWHTEADTLDKISAASMEKVGRLILGLLPALEKRLAAR